MYFLLTLGDESVLYYHNFDYNQPVTPVKPLRLKEILEQSNYDQTETAFLVNGFTHGFSLGYQGDRNVRMTARNLPLRGLGDKKTLWNKVMKEVKAKRFAGPFTEIPFHNYIQSPIGLVPKDNGKDVRLIFYLSHPKGLGTSVNDGTPDEECSVTYPDFDDAVQLCILAGRGCMISRLDMKSVFRNLCVSKCDYWLLVMRCTNPHDNKDYYFFDLCLPFGHSKSCNLFQRFSNAIAHVVKFRTHKDLVNYLDDYFFCSLLKLLCNNQVRQFISICEYICFPVNMEKTYWGTTRMVFLGMLIDTVLQMVFVPVEKVEKATQMINEILNNKKHKATLLQIQRICGFLNFLGKSVVPGHAFTRRLYRLTSDLEGKLKPHHHLTVSAETRSDLIMWKKFLENPLVYSRPFFHFDRFNLSERLNFYTDASGVIRFGGLCSNSWMMEVWDQEFLSKKPSIEYQELFALVAAVVQWIGRYPNRKLTIFCDNQMVCKMVKATSTSCRNCMVLIRIMLLSCLEHNVQISAKYVRSVDNELADSLSGGKFHAFLTEARKRGIQPERRKTSVPHNMWPVSKIWLKN